MLLGAIGHSGNMICFTLLGILEKHVTYCNKAYLKHELFYISEHTGKYVTWYIKSCWEHGIHQTVRHTGNMGYFKLKGMLRTWDT